MSSDVRRSNPFSTRYIRPGAMRFLFSGGETAASLVASLAAQNWRGQIVGPHGSGKSTLLAALQQHLSASGRRVRHITLRDGQRTMPRGWVREALAHDANLMIVDGYEQLSVWSRCWLQLVCWRRGWGLLVTTHADVGLPMLYQTVSDLDIAQAVVKELLKSDPMPGAAAHVEAAYRAAKGNLREALFLLYDVWESRQVAPRQ